MRARISEKINDLSSDSEAPFAMPPPCGAPRLSQAPRRALLSTTSIRALYGHNAPRLDLIRLSQMVAPPSVVDQTRRSHKYSSYKWCNPGLPFQQAPPFHEPSNFKSWDATGQFGISGGSPLRCAFYRRGEKIYDISTSSQPRSTTTIIRDGTVIASIEWSAVSRTKSKVVIEGHTGTLDRTFPKAGRWTRSRIYKTINGKTLKWKINGSCLCCVAPDTGFNLAFHNGVAINAFSVNTSTLDIFDEGLDIQDMLVATWVMMEVIIRGRNPTASPLGDMLGEGPWGGNGGSNGGGDDGGGSGVGGDGGNGDGGGGGGE
ncbi:unnamed protein product [Rhizoctonia solani]|uniref:DUF6593 domain-containing protein n=1 Tax=Rhizoctonia solani TaxID=456999 RepID=A0A8H3H9P4_9AGAM|nr:unnamed protein product [Rhizoctonia solani]